MCWRHMIVNVRKREQIGDHKAELIKDINFLQGSPTEKHFRVALKLFFLKWESSHCSNCSIDHGPQILEFLKYFEKEWVTNKPNWFEGLARNVPSTNNPQESTNNPKNIPIGVKRGPGAPRKTLTAWEQQPDATPAAKRSRKE